MSVGLVQPVMVRSALFWMVCSFCTLDVDTMEAQLGLA